MDVRWWVFVHLIGVFAFLLGHGVSVAVAFRLRRERDRGRIRDLLAFSGSSVRVLYGSLVLIVVGGMGAARAQHSWGQTWTWLSLVTLAVTIVLMLVIGKPYYKGIGEATGLRPSGAPRVSDEDLAQRLTSARSLVVAGIGFAGLGFILWMMVFKPA